MPSLSPPAPRHPRRPEAGAGCRGHLLPSAIQMASATLGPSACSGEVHAGSFAELRQPLAILTQPLATSVQLGEAADAAEPRSGPRPGPWDTKPGARPHRTTRTPGEIGRSPELRALAGALGPRLSPRQGYSGEPCSAEPPAWAGCEENAPRSLGTRDSFPGPASQQRKEKAAGGHRGPARAPAPAAGSVP